MTTTPGLTPTRLAALHNVSEGAVTRRWPLARRGAPYWMLDNERISRQSTYDWLSAQRLIEVQAGGFGSMGAQPAIVTPLGRQALDAAAQDA